MLLTITAVTSGKATSYQEFVQYKSRHEMMSKKDRDDAGRELGEPVESRLPDIGR